MEVAQYYVTTLTNAAQNIGPIVVGLVVGYFVFIKLPFLFALKVNKEHKPKQEQDSKKNSQIETMPHQERLKSQERENSEKQKSKDKEREEERLRQEKKKEERERARHDQEKKNQKKEEKSKNENKVSAPASSSAAEIFELKSGESLSKAELKKRYHELLRQNHPDKVATLGADFKKLAEKKTKDINSAYEELKKKAS
jgi:DnaJ-domain-containing protein 1